MDARLSEEQELLCQTAREFLDRECPSRTLRAILEEGPGAGEALWKQIVELGWPGLAVPEDCGGSGLGMVELALLLEQTGRSLLPGPLLGTAVVGAGAVGLAGSPSQQRCLLPAIADGSLRIALAHLEPGADWSAGAVSSSAERVSEGYRLQGRKAFVADALAATHLLVTALLPPPSSGNVGLFLVEMRAPGLAVRPVSWLDATRPVAEAALEGVTVAGDALLTGSREGGAALLERVLDRARVALSAESVGGAARALELSVAYARERQQFGRPIGSFQAIQHRCADMFVCMESARSAALYAAWAIDRDRPDAHSSACLAKAVCSEAFSKVAGDAIQVHGGLGFTWEQDPHLYFKRAKTSELAYGTPTACREWAARVRIDAA